MELNETVSVEKTLMLSKLKAAYVTIFIVAGLALFLGILGLLNDTLNDAGIGWEQVITGLIMMILAYFTVNKAYKALMIAIVLMALNVIVSFIYIINSDIPAGTGGLGIVIQVSLMRQMIPGLNAIKVLNAQNTKSEPKSPAAVNRPVNNYCTACNRIYENAYVCPIHGNKLQGINL